MKKMKLLRGTNFILVAILSLTLSCSRDNDPTEDIEQSPNTIALEATSALAATSCNETSFPNLGPGATNGQASGCNDASSPNNIGTLDCRSSATFGGYANVGGGFGRYRLTGSTARFDGTRTRVERFFNRVNRGENTSSTLNYEFIIDEVSSGATCIVQAHAEGEIVDGMREGETARSAVFLLYVKRALRNGSPIRDSNGREVYVLETHESTVPFTNLNSGSRTITRLRNVTQGVSYNLSYKTGYNSNEEAESTITVSGGGNTRSSRLAHTYTSQSVTTRYGAYEACDVCDDDRFQIRIRNVELCRSN